MNEQELHHWWAVYIGDGVKRRPREMRYVFITRLLAMPSQATLSVFLSLLKINSERISMNFAVGEIVIGTRKQDTTENSNRRQSVLPRCRTGADAQRMNSQLSLYILRQMRSRTKFSKLS